MSHQSNRRSKRTPNSAAKAPQRVPIASSPKELQRLDWTAEKLASRRKNDPQKLAPRRPLRKETTLTVKDIARRLHLGTSKSANTNLHRHIKTAPVTGHKRSFLSKPHSMD